MDENLKKLLEFIAENMWRESGFLSPQPAWNVNAHELLDGIHEIYGLPKEQIGEVVNAVRIRIENKR